MISTTIFVPDKKIANLAVLLLLLYMTIPAYGQQARARVSDQQNRSRVSERVDLSDRLNLQSDKKALQEFAVELNDPTKKISNSNIKTIKNLYNRSNNWSRLDPNTATVHMEVAEAFERASRYSKRPDYLDISKSAYKRTIESTSGRTKLIASTKLCAQLLRQNDPKEAAKVMSDVKMTLQDPSVDRATKSQGFYNFGSALMQLKEYNYAYDLLKAAVDADPTSRIAARAAGEAALHADHETTGIPQIFELTNKQLEGFNFKGVKDNLKKAMDVEHWKGHKLYPLLIEQMLRYFVASDVKAEVFEREWWPFLENIHAQTRLDPDSKTMILDINDIYSGNLKKPNVIPEAVKRMYFAWEKAKNEGRFKSGLEALSSFLKMRGDYYYRQKDENSLENSLKCYSHAWALNVENIEAGLYMANVLLLDIKKGNNRLDQQYHIIDLLFDAKNALYQRYFSGLVTDWERIMKCHIILATIFEQQQAWGPGGNPRTAIFQWDLAQNALDKLDASVAAENRRRFGPVIDRRLKQAREQWRKINQ